MDPGWLANMVICVGVQLAPNGFAATTAASINNTFKSRVGHALSAVVGRIMQDGAAMCVARELGYDAELCGMHSADKIGQSAIGNLTRSKNKVTVNPFPEGLAIMVGQCGLNR